MPVPRQQLKVSRFRVYNGITLNQQVLSGVDAERHKVTITVQPLGLIVSQREPFSDKLIPWANILECDIKKEDEVPAHLSAVVGGRI